MKPITDAEEQLIRQHVRRVYNDEGHTHTYTAYPLDSIERLIAIDEGQKIEFEDLTNGN